MSTRPSTGVVVIGRNEGARLVRCLDALAGSGAPVVYVDSASSDGSPDAARRRSADVVEVDPALPMSAARSRNEGFARLLALHPGISYVQFIDGDCEIDAGWIEAGARALAARPDAAVVCGRLAERNRDATIYNRLCDMEWAGEVGDVKSCGGVAMMRADAFRAAGGFRTDMNFGEEPELCFRFRAAGWRIVRIAHPMARHDAAMTSFSQWWRRASRGGHAYAEGAAIHGDSPERYNVKRVRSIVFWGGIVPAGMVVLLVASVWLPWLLVLAAAALCGYVLLAVRIYASRRRGGVSSADALLYAAFCTLAKGPEFAGASLYWRNRRRGRRTGWIDYKAVEPAGGGRVGTP